MSSPEQPKHTVVNRASDLPDLVRDGARRAVALVDKSIKEEEVQWAALEVARSPFKLDKLLAIEIITTARFRPGAVKHVGAIWCDTPEEGARVLAAHASAFAQPDRLSGAVESAFQKATVRVEAFSKIEGSLSILETSVIAVSEHTCGACSGHGAVGCRPCGETGRVLCRHCYSGQVTCGGCAGRGRIQRTGSWDRNGGAVIIWDNCSLCFGSGRQRCHNCFGSTKVSCNPCGGTGALQCRPCVGHGLFTDWFEISIGAGFETRSYHTLPALVTQQFEAWIQRGFPQGDMQPNGYSLRVDRPARTADGTLRTQVTLEGRLDLCQGRGRFRDTEVQAAALALDTPALAFTSFLDGALRQAAAASLQGVTSPGQCGARVATSPVLVSAVEYLTTTPNEDLARLEAIIACCSGAVVAASLADFCRDYRRVKRKFCNRVWLTAWSTYLRRTIPISVLSIVVAYMNIVPRIGPNLWLDLFVRMMVVLACTSIPSILAVLSVRGEARREMGDGATMTNRMNFALVPATSVLISLSYLAISFSVLTSPGVPSEAKIQTSPTKMVPSSPRPEPVEPRRGRKNGFVPI